MEIIEKSISGLYYDYKKVSDDKIRGILNNVLIVYRKIHKGEEGFYKIEDESFLKIYDTPRTVSVNFDVQTSKKVEGLAPYLKFNYLVKSSSRFFLKADIGEILDQIPYYELHNSKLKAIVIEEGNTLLPDTSGEHFIMWATLLTDVENIEKNDSDTKQS